MPQKADVMVVAPHPDDAEIGVAGTVACWVNQGKTVIYVVCTNGDKGTSDRSMRPEDLAIIREKEQRAAADTVGVTEVVFLGYSDQTLEYSPEFREKMVRLIRMYRPDIVVADDPYRRYRYWHRDHRMTGQVTLDAVFPYARDHLSYPAMLEEGLEPHKVKEMWLWGPEEPNYRSNIAETFDTKIRALKCHKSQVGDDRWPGMEEWLRDWAKEMAEGEDFKLAEAFHRIEIWW